MKCISHSQTKDTSEPLKPLCFLVCMQNFNHTSSDVNVPATTVDAGNASPLHVVSPRVMGGNVAKVSWQVGEVALHVL